KSSWAFDSNIEKELDSVYRMAIIPKEKDMCYGIIYQEKRVHLVLKAGLTDPSGPTDWEQAKNRSGKPEEEYIHSDWAWCTLQGQ
ncbi:40937_t:CDS:2, partial [Gigaspora margarita]